MSCPTCDHTMASIAHETLHIWQCERCGTLKTQHFLGIDPPNFYVPKLVGRCREFAQRFDQPAKVLAQMWRHLGIAESINLPADRRGT
jgi:hypothetical protein